METPAVWGCGRGRGRGRGRGHGRYPLHLGEGSHQWSTSLVRHHQRHPKRYSLRYLLGRCVHVLGDPLSETCQRGVVSTLSAAAAAVASSSSFQETTTTMFVWVNEEVSEARPQPPTTMAMLTKRVGFDEG